MKPIILALALTGLALAGCTGTQWERATSAEVNPEYHSGNEIPPGPGLFTGKKGAWELALPDDPSEREPDRDPTKPVKVRRKDR